MWKMYSPVGVCLFLCLALSPSPLSLTRTCLKDASGGGESGGGDQIVSELVAT